MRQLSGAPLAAWARSEELLALTLDPSFSVRKSANFNLGLVPRDPALAERAWAYMADPNGTAWEALRTYVAHAPVVEARQRLAHLALTDRRERVW